MESQGVQKKAVGFLGIVLIAVGIVIVVTHLPLLPLAVLGVALYLILRHDPQDEKAGAPTGPEADKAR